MSKNPNVCFVGKNLKEEVREKIRTEVCSQLAATYIDKSDKKHYCVLHFPSENKESDFFIGRREHRFASNSSLIVFSP